MAAAAPQGRQRITTVNLLTAKDARARRQCVPSLCFLICLFPTILWCWVLVLERQSSRCTHGCIWLGHLPGYIFITFAPSAANGSRPPSAASREVLVASVASTRCTRASASPLKRGDDASRTFLCMRGRFEAGRRPDYHEVG